MSFLKISWLGLRDGFDLIWLAHEILIYTVCFVKTVFSINPEWHSVHCSSHRLPEITPNTVVSLPESLSKSQSIKFDPCKVLVSCFTENERQFLKFRHGDCFLWRVKVNKAISTTAMSRILLSLAILVLVVEICKYYYHYINVLCYFSFHLNAHACFQLLNLQDSL